MKTAESDRTLVSDPHWLTLPWAVTPFFAFTLLTTPAELFRISPPSMKTMEVDGTLLSCPHWLTLPMGGHPFFRIHFTDHTVRTQ